MGKREPCNLRLTRCQGENRHVNLIWNNHRHEHTNVRSFAVQGLHLTSVFISGGDREELNSVLTELVVLSLLGQLVALGQIAETIRKLLKSPVSH